MKHILNSYLNLMKLDERIEIIKLYDSQMSYKIRNIK